MIMTAPATAPRCAWAAQDPLLRDYHDTEWGVMPPTDNAAFELLTLEVFQAGLAWRTVLAKRPAFRRAFADFAIPLVAAFDASDVARLLNDPNIIRNRRKIEATIANARAVLAIIDEVGTFRDWLSGLPADADAAYSVMHQRLTGCGPIVCRSYLEAIGIIPPPHEPGCWKEPGR